MRLWVTLALLGSTFAQAQPFVRTEVPGREDKGPLCVTWNKREFIYVVDAAGSARTPGDSEFFAIDASFASWQAVSDTCSDFNFIRGARQPKVQIGRGTETSNVIVFREQSCRSAAPELDPCQADGSCTNTYNCWDHSDYTIALTTTTFSTKTGAIYDADIELNGAPHVDGTRFLFTTISSPPCGANPEAVTCVATDIQNTLTHEIGHAVGFDHVENPGATMEATAPPGETQKRIIDVGLSEGFCQTYPKGLPPVPCDELAQLRRKIIAKTAGTPSLSALGCSALPAGGGLWVLGLLLLGRARRR